MIDISEQDVPELRAQGDLITFIKQGIAAARAENARRRALVLRYPDLAERLIEPPLRHTTPEHWTGYVPPASDAPSLGGAEPINHSPARKALAAIVAEAEHRAATGQKASAA
jgi:hypothetical protein